MADGATATAEDQYTDAQLTDGTTLRFKGQLNPDQVRQKVTAYRLKQSPPNPEKLRAEGTQETEFEKENKPSFFGEAARTAAKVPFKTLGFDTSSQTPASDWLKAQGQNLIGLVTRPKNDWAPTTLRNVHEQMDDLSREAKAIRTTGRSIEPAAPETPGAMQARPSGPVFRTGGGLQHPFMASAVREAASMLPVLGPGAIHAGHEIARASTPQEMGEGIAEAGGTVGQAFLATKPGQRFAESAVEKVGRPISRVTAEPIARVAGEAFNRLRVPEAQKAMTQAIQPSANIPKAQESIAIAGPRMQQIRETQGIEIPKKGPEAIKAVLDLNREAKTQILQAIEQRMGPVADLRPNASAVAKGIRSAVDDLTLEQEPGAKAAMERRAETYERNGAIAWSIRQMEERMHTLNNRLANAYNRPTPGEARVSADTEMDFAEAREVRKLVDESVEKLSGEGVKDLKREYGAQRDVEKALARQYAVATRVKGAPLWEGLAYLHAAGEVMSGNVLGAAKAAATLAVGKRLQTLRDSGYLLNQAFHGDKAFRASEPIPPHAGPPPPKGLLPGPATPLPWNEPDTSGPIRGGRYTTPKALLPENAGNPPAKFNGAAVKAAKAYAPSEKAAVTAEPAKNYGPEFNAQQAQEEINRNEATLRNPKATAEERSIAEGNLREAKAASKEVAPTFNEAALKAAREPEPVEVKIKGITAEEPKTPKAKREVVPPIEGRFSHEEITDAEGLLASEAGAMSAADRPGVYFDEGETTAYGRQGGWKTGLRMGGQWRGVRSGRDMYPFLREHPDWSPSQIEKALRNKDSAFYKRAMEAAIKFINRGEETGEAAEPETVEPGAEEFPFGAKAQPEETPVPAKEPEGVLPGMGEHVRAQEAGAGRVKAEELTRELNTPRSIEGAAGEMETKSPLFRGTEASPQKEIFGQQALNAAKEATKQPGPGDAEYEALKNRLAALSEKSGITSPQGKKVADRFRSIADNMDAQIEDRRREMTQNPTPKRMKEYRSRLHDADNMERVQWAMRALADAHENGTVPRELAGVRTKDEIYRLVYKGLKGGGYYDVIPDPEYGNKTPQAKALQDLMEKQKPESSAEKAEKLKRSEVSRMEAEVQFSNIPGYFPTPSKLAERVVSSAGVEDGMRVLEPSAGSGSLADVVRQEAPKAKIDTVEHVPRLQKILEAKGYDLAGTDFLEMKPEESPVYDRIVMNPPFEKGADAVHVRHAYDFLKPGGKLSAIMSEGTFFRSDKATTAFREWLDEVGGESEKIPQAAFTGPEAKRQTGVASRLVTITKSD